MSKYIDAELAKETIREYLKTKAPMPRLCKKVMDIAIGAVDLTPTADVVEVRHGEWGFDGLGWTCSECGEYALTNKSKVQVHSTYCPHCGAKMDGERREK